MAAIWALGSLILAIIVYVTSDFARKCSRNGLLGLMAWMSIGKSTSKSMLFEEVPEKLHVCRNPTYGTCFNSARREEGLAYLLGTFTGLQPKEEAKLYPKPALLSFSDEYFRTDAKNILICFFATVEETDNHRGTSNSLGPVKIIRFERSSLKFKEIEDVIEAELDVPSQSCALINRRTKSEYEKILFYGFPPWYKRVAKTTANVTFNFPKMGDGNLRRGGWIVAVGLGDIVPLPYFTSNFGKFQPFDYPSHGHHRGGTGSYWSACLYLQSVMDTRIHQAFASSDTFGTAKKAIDRLIAEHTASFIEDSLSGTCLDNCTSRGQFVSWLEESDLEFACELFNKRANLTPTEISRLRPLLLPILAGVVRGLASVFRYLNDHSFQIRDEDLNLLCMDQIVYLRSPKSS